MEYYLSRSSLSMLFHSNNLVTSIRFFFIEHNFANRTSCDGHYHLTKKYIDVIKNTELIKKRSVIRNKEVTIDDEILKEIERILLMSPDINIVNQRTKYIYGMISRYTLMKNIMLALLIIGIASLVLHISLCGAIGSFIKVYIVWILGCLSLFITAKLIIKEWTRKKYAKSRSR